MRKTLMTILAGLVGGTAAWAQTTTEARADDYDDDDDVESGPVGWAPWQAGREPARKPMPATTAETPPPAPAPVEPKDEPDKTLALIHFAFDSAEVGVDRVELDEAKMWIGENPDHFLVIEGHTDAAGTDAYNAGLATRRAENVRSELIELGADSERLVVGVYGEGAPISADDAENRRVLVRGTDESLEEITKAALDKGLAVVWSYEPSAEAVARREKGKSGDTAL